ncbi:transcription antitermination factor NusB [Candidatus Similichlamydia epinepheli]|uniref:transcription antitermination factor NusB n=1 Tax=Candidatus Similichlamydia epinepheli TaxID=1903953 RepID=UPI000D3C8CC7|nr:transcription antitermination factor NusB [Candidatus Similichlamydia epinepheli]
MSISLSQKREALFLIVHAAAWGPQDEDGLVHLIADQLKIPVRSVRECLPFARQLGKAIPELDKKIREASNMSWEGIGYTEKTLLRVILFEKLHGPPLESPILLAESVRLSKKFSGEHSSSFLYGLLARLFDEGVEVSEEIL